jgi:hypothetical protein
VHLTHPKSSGPDGIPNIFLINCIDTLADILKILFNRSLSLGIFPEIWKSGHIIPILKKGDKNDVSNYRPICILSAIPKLFESIVLNKITTQISSLITPYQHGFVSRKSTLTNLSIYNEFLVQILSERGQVDSVYTDFSKAFDSVCHNILLQKLYAYGVRGTFYKWIETYLKNRVLLVKVGNSLSEPFLATSGVPQGSHLGPVLFNLFINDIVQVFGGVRFLLFADDLKIFHDIKSTDDCISLQDNLNRLHDWCDRNMLHLNTNKCQVIRFRKTRSPILFNYNFNGTSIKSVNSLRDLGVTFSEDLSFNLHIEEVLGKAMRILGFVLRLSSDLRSLTSFRLLYVSLVRPLLEYNTTVWSPYYSNSANSLEKVQRKFLRFINYKKGIPIEDINYSSLMNELKLPSLSNRRKLFDTIFLYKIIRGHVDCMDLVELIKYHVPTRNTRQLMLFHERNSKTNYSYYSPIARLHRFGNEFHSVDFFSDSLLKLKKAITDSFFSLTD